MQRAERLDAAHIGERSEYRFYFMLAYPLFLAATIVIRLAGGSTRRRGAPRVSIFSETADRTHGAIPWVFAGR